MALEPSSSSSRSKDQTQQDTETDSEKRNTRESLAECKGDGSVNSQYVPVKRGKKRAKVDPVVEAIETVKQVIQKDPTKDFLEFLKDENERARQHEIRVLQMMMAPQPIALSQDNSRTTGQNYCESEAMVSTDLPEPEQNNGGNQQCS